MGLVAMNCVTVLWQWETYVYTYSNLTSSIPVANCGYTQLLSTFRPGFCPISRHITRWLKPYSFLMRHGGITHYCNPKSRTKCATDI